MKSASARRAKQTRDAFESLQLAGASSDCEFRCLQIASSPAVTWHTTLPKMADEVPNGTAQPNPDVEMKEEAPEVCFSIESRLEEP